MSLVSSRAAKFLWVILFATAASANPYPDPRKVPRDAFKTLDLGKLRAISRRTLDAEGIEVLRVQVDWEAQGEKFSVSDVVRERSGTPAIIARSKRPDALGSYRATLKDAETGETLSHDSIGTGMEYRKLVRAITFRFPVPSRKARLEMLAENPVTGVQEKVLDAEIDPASARALDPRDDVEARVLMAASREPKLVVNVYAEGYLAQDRERFFREAAKVPSALVDKKIPRLDQLEFRAVFAPSTQKLGSAKNLGLPVPERDSFLGLYYPYWNDFGRWYHIVYPTREKRFREGLAQAPYDYPIALVDSDEYWGVGNYRELTAIPSKSFSFAYLLTHEFGHYLGLNEEYESGGATELAFAPEIGEPWSQNITFLTDPSLKWGRHVADSTPLPTPWSFWSSQSKPVGAYPGGYAETEPLGKSHKPVVRSCVMESYPSFCPVCLEAVEERIRFDLGH